MNLFIPRATNIFFSSVLATIIELNLVLCVFGLFHFVRVHEYERFDFQYTVVAFVNLIHKYF